MAGARLAGSVLTPDGWLAGEVAFDGRIVAVEGQRTLAPKAPFILPGVSGLHVHGGGGHDVMAGEDAVRGAARPHASHGTTSLLATSVAAPPGAIAAFLAHVSAVAKAPGEGEARVPGAHLEGPFIDPGKLGAQPSPVRSIWRWRKRRSRLGWSES